MDRARCFSILGLSENATKEQVKRAYGRKLATYKGPNYADEPAYAERKMAQLHQAYEEAYALASSGADAVTTSRIEHDVQPLPKKKAAKASHLLEAEREAGANKREKFHQWMERRDDEKQSRKDGKRKELPKLQKPGLFKLKDKLSEIKEEVVSQLDFMGEDGGDFFEQETFVKESESEKDDFTDFVKDCVYTEEKPEPGRGFSGTGSSLDEAEDTTSEYNGSNTHTGKASKGLSPELIKLIVSIVVIIVAAVGGCVDDSADYEDETKYAYIYSSDWDVMTETDEVIATKAGKSYDLLLDGNSYGSSTMHDESESDYLEEANLFAEKYFNMDSLTAVTSHLYENYPSFGIDTEQPLSVQLDAIFAFYGFADLESAIWYENPYTEDRMCGYNDYLKYLNQYYDM